MTTAAIIFLVLHILGGGLTDISKAITIVQQIEGQVIPPAQAQPSRQAPKHRTHK